MKDQIKAAYARCAALRAQIKAMRGTQGWTPDADRALCAEYLATQRSIYQMHQHRIE